MDIFLVDTLFCFEAVGTQHGQYLELGACSASTGMVKGSSLTKRRAQISLHVPQKLSVKHLGFFVCLLELHCFYCFIYLLKMSFMYFQIHIISEFIRKRVVVRQSPSEYS